MRQEESCLDLNHSPEQSAAVERSAAIAVVEMKPWLPYTVTDFHEEQPDLIDSLPNRTFKEGTTKKECANYNSDGEEECIFRQQHNTWSWPLRRALPSTNDVNGHAAATPESAWLMPQSQIDVSNSTAGSEILDKRKRRAESTEEDANNISYECRFCEMKFTKSQALGGHMNRHREEREREQLHQAQALIYNSMHNNIQQRAGMPTLFQNSGVPVAKFSPRTPPSLPSQFSGSQSDQQSSIYHQSPLSWNQGGSTIAYGQVPDISSFAAKQEDWPSSGRSTAYATPLNDMSYLSQGRNQDLLGMSYERKTHSPSNHFPSETNTSGVLPVQRVGFIQRQRSGVGAGAQSSSSASGLTERRFNPSSHQSSSYPFLGTDYNLSNVTGDGATQHFNLQGGSSNQAIPLITTPNSSSIPSAAAVDFAEKSTMRASSPDFENLWFYSQQKTTPPLSSIPNDEFGLSLGSDTMATGPTPHSPGTGLGLPGDNSARQRINVCADSSSLSFIDYNAEIESKYNQDS